ncbi:isoflavone reductase family protein [Rutstroemia sp. NJR-2017a WRK4]|nr:isoflavone reductase family protein [Rutstroemia sp. NJR-2017a WRK4]
MSLVNIVLVGASGNFGGLVLPELVKTDFNLTTVIRETSNATFPSGVQVAKSDFSLKSLTEIFQGKDAVVSMLPIAALADQGVVIEAAIAAGVKRFIPSEYGFDSSNPAAHAAVPLFEGKKKHLELLASKENVISWTALITGLFFDWTFFLGLTGFDAKTKTVTLVDGGKTRFTASTSTQISRALIAVLKHADETSNKMVFVESFTTTQTEVLAAVENVTGQKWKVVEAKSEEIRAAGFQKVGEGNYVEGAGLLIQAAVLGKEALEDRSHVEGGLWNERLGLEEESVEKVVEVIFRNAPNN